MEYKINEIYHGFKLKDKYTVKELDSVAHVFIHEYSGAQLLHLESEDDNKVFSVAFRTPPSDSTGVPHIVEHCVLSGSRKYATKEPFMDMVKGSLKTFINAMTFSDKTIYPVASRNDKDFFNLMDVYLDAVYFPKIYDIPEIFMQEGWHYDINDKDDPLTLTGVVYNEMRGAYSTPESILGDVVSNSLYPDSCYKNSSGGNPDFIPDLTPEAFTDFHKKYYHPSNSYIFLYGNGDIDQYLKHMDGDYLSKFEKIEVDSEIIVQTPQTKHIEVNDFYPISANESSENKDYLSLNYNLGLVTDPIGYISAQIIKHALFNSTAAPVKKALLDAGIGEDIVASLDDGLQVGLSIVAKNTSVERKEDFKNIINTTLMQLINRGIEKDLIKSSINIVEYDMREASRFPTKGIIYHINSMQSWLYSDNPTMYLQFGDMIDQLRVLVETDHFEKFIHERFINNMHQSFVSLQPEKGLGEKKAKLVKDKLAAYKANLSDDEIQKLIDSNKILREKQLAPDTEEALATIPKLAVSDVDPKTLHIPYAIEQQNEVKILHFNMFSNDISYVDYLFDLKLLPLELAPYANILSNLLTKMDTKTKSYSDLSNEIYASTGGITTQGIVFIQGDTDQAFHPRFVIRGKAIGENVVSLNELVREITTETDLSDKKRLKEILMQLKTRLEQNMIQSGNTIAARRAASYHSPLSQYSEHFSGLDYYWLLTDILKDFDAQYDKVISNLLEVYKMIFNTNNMLVSFTGLEKDFKLFNENLPSFTDKLNHTKYQTQSFDLDYNQVNEGIASSGNVQFVSKASNYAKFGYTYSGKMHVLSAIINSEFLHDRVRAKGGAYGCSMSISRIGTFEVTSYRDPNLKETLSVYDEMADYVENIDLDQEALTKFIIGAIGRVDSAMTPHMKARTAVADYIADITEAQLQQERDEILSTTPDDIRAFAPMLRDMLADNYRCVLGNDTVIRENEDVFEHIVQLKK